MRASFRLFHLLRVEFEEVGDAGEVADHDCAGCLRDVGQGTYIIHRLLKRRIQILSARFHLDEDLALPEAVGVALRAIREFDSVLEGVEDDRIDAEDREELLQEALRLCLFVFFVA